MKQGPTPVEEKPKKVRFNKDDKMGSKPTLPPSITLFLAKGETIKQPNTPTSTIMGPADTSWPIPKEDPSGVPSPTGEARSKVALTWPSIAQSRLRPEGPGPGSHPLFRWIFGEMGKITHCPWWNALRISSRMTLCPWIVSEDLTEHKATFQLPLAQKKASGWWEAQPGIFWTPPRNVPDPHWCLWPKGFLGCETEDPGLSLSTAGLSQEVRIPHRSSLWGVTGTTKMYGFPDVPLWGWNSQGFPPEAHRRGTWNLPCTWAKLKHPKFLEVHELEHHAEQIAAPVASLHPHLPNQVTSLPRRETSPHKG